jgi:hypothetical protein
MHYKQMRSDWQNSTRSYRGMVEVFLVPCPAWY